MELFARAAEEFKRKKAPLADRMRPRNIEEFVGQEHLLGEGRGLRRMISSGELFSFVLWGPPGVGKSTLARLVAEATGAHFVAFSAVLSGVGVDRCHFTVATGSDHQHEVIRAGNIHTDHTVIASQAHTAYSTAGTVTGS